MKPLPILECCYRYRCLDATKSIFTPNARTVAATLDHNLAPLNVLLLCLHLALLLLPPLFEPLSPLL